MPYLPTAQSWLTQSTLLLQARPSTARITTKYTLSPPRDSLHAKASKPHKTRSTDNPSSTTTGEPKPTTPSLEPPRATLVLKTYDPASGTTLKYSTTKAAEVSRLIQILGRLARPMAGLPEIKEDVSMVVKEEEVVATQVPEQKPVQQGAGGGKGKKKKGKK